MNASDYEDYGWEAPPKEEVKVVVDPCEKCAYTSATLSKTEGKLYCAWHGKEVFPEHTCEDFRPPSKKRL